MQHPRANTPDRSLLDSLGRVELGEGTSFRGMIVFPVFTVGEGTPTLAYRTLAEALAEGWVEVVEKPTATVPELVLRNRGTTMVFVLDGEEIVGGRQNRIVNASFLVGAGAEVVLPVSCVEQGRWHDTSPRFSAGEVSFARLRRAKEQQVRISLQHYGRPVADQMEVWSSVAELQAETATSSPSGAMHDVYLNRAADLAAYEEACRYQPGAVGLVVGLNGQVAGADLFDQPRTAEALWPRLIRSYALDAATDGPIGSVSREQAASLLGRARDARCEVYPSLALGHDVRLRGAGVAGAALVYESVVVHASLFPADDTARTARGVARASLRRRARGLGPA